MAIEKSRREHELIWEDFLPKGVFDNALRQSRTHPPAAAVGQKVAGLCYKVAISDGGLKLRVRFGSRIDALDPIFRMTGL